jgi:hypothetical protein
LIVTWDENDGSTGKQIATIVVGAGTKAGTSSKTVNHYSVLRTIEDVYSLPHLGGAASANSLF